MSLNHGSGVSRALSPQERAFQMVVWAKGKPPLDSELNLMGSLDLERTRQIIASQMPSGFLLDPTRAEHDFRFSPQWVNHFHLGAPHTPRGAIESQEAQPVLWANVNGWIIPVCGSNTLDPADTHNVIKLYPPPSSDARIDFVFLEAWACIVGPNPSTANKPSASTIWRHGNVQYGGTNITDDLEDPTIGVGTTRRVQVQYRLRVYGSGGGLGAGVNLAVHPDGLTDPNILGQGAATAPVAGLRWTNMRETLGDPSLWRAGAGDAQSIASLGTIDGYTYAIPVCAVFRRAAGAYVAVSSSGNPNQNGAFLRTPGASLLVNPLDGARPLLEASLTTALSTTAGVSSSATVAITNLNGCGLEDTALSLPSTFLKIGDEIIGVSAVNITAGTITIPAGGRGRWGTAVVGHAAGTSLRFFNTRPDGLYADEVAAQDVLDLRHAVNPGDWDYNRLLAHNVTALLTGDLRTSWKVSNPGNTQGTVVHEVCELYAGNTSSPNHTEPLDGPDGIRTVWSDAATIQPDVTLLLDPAATRDANNLVGFTNASLDANTDWDVGADLKPAGFMNVGGGSDGWHNGSSIHLFIGGSTGEGGARGTFRASGTRDVRFVTPQEYWRTGYPIVDPQGGNQHPVTLRFLGEKQHNPPPQVDDDIAATYPGPLYPWRESRFERPILVLGGLLNSALRYSGVAVTHLSSNVSGAHFLDLTSEGVDFDAEGGFFSLSAGAFANDPSLVSVPLLRGERTLYGMLTNDGQDITGASSEVYLLLFGDPDARDNNGAFRVIGAGTAGYTTHNAPNAGSLVLEPVSADWAAWDTGTGNSVTVDFRSQWHNADDVSSYDSRTADLVVVLTDIGGEAGEGTPWDHDSVAAAWRLGQDGVSGPRYAPSKAVLSLTLLYHPGRAAMARVPDQVTRFALRGGSEETRGSYLRRSPSALDTTFSAIGTATDETYWNPVHVQTWNRLPARGWHAPDATYYGGLVVGFTEQDREAEVFIDRGSKTVIFRPFRNRAMTLQALTWSSEFSSGCLLGSYTFTEVSGTPVKDPLGITTGNDGSGHGTSGKRMGFSVPREFMPRFGRQDIPYYRLLPDATPAAGGWMPGINHLFTDTTDLTSPVFNIIGGEPNTGGTQVNPLFLVTRSSEIAYARSNASYGPQGVAALGARKTTDIDPNAGAQAVRLIRRLQAVNSSDLGRGLQGIQMPPYVGIARLYGVYEYEDYQNKGGTTFASNRYRMEAHSAVNLLREDATAQTLFILQHGARDFTQETGDHTYIIPSNVLDLTRIPAAPGIHDGYEAGSSVFGDFDYVVECTVFIFAKGFIDENNLVLARKRSGTYTLNTDGDDPEIENVPMCIPAPAGVNDRLYIAYNRTAYQGDPYMTRDGATRQSADYEARYGRLTASQAHLLRTPVQQFDSQGAFVPQTHNARALEVLASMDFYTTMGTGKIGGNLYPGTPLDVAHLTPSPLASTRMPTDSTSRDWRFQVRAFTEGQKENTSRATAAIEVTNNAPLATANTADDAYFVRFTLLDGTIVTLMGATSSFATDTLIPDGALARDIFTVDLTGKDHHLVDLVEEVDFGTLSPATTNVVAVTATLTHPDVARIPSGAIVTAHVSSTTRLTASGVGDILFVGRYLGSGQVSIVAQYPSPVIPFAVSDPGGARNVRIMGAWDPPSLAVDASTTQTFSWPGADPSLAQVFLVEDNLSAGVVVSAYASALDTITIRIKNLSTSTVDVGSTQFKVALLEDIDPTAMDVDLSDTDLRVKLSWEEGDRQVTANNLVSTINAHPHLKRTVRAYNAGTPKVILEAIPVGSEGNQVKVEVGILAWTGAVGSFDPDTLTIRVADANDKVVGHRSTSTYLHGGTDIPVNAGSGASPLQLTGLTERLPLGVLVQDSDFLCENPLGDNTSALHITPSTLRPVQSLLPLTNGGEEYSRFSGSPGEIIALADVQIAPTSWAAWTEESPDGATRKFRIYRGGGAAFLLSGDNPGGPLDWVSGSFPSSVAPVLKGGILACKALLVRNFPEEALEADGPAITTQGDEIQMVILTNAILADGNSTSEGLALQGVLSPSGYGEGTAAADRYLLKGRPMIRGYVRDTPDPDSVQLAVYPEDQRDS